jgi:aspartyl-tRNA(Asn)/glutamyl-tRNA(Gln) amidotransferase subunit A
VPWRFLDQLASEPRHHFDMALEKAKALGARIVEVDLDLLQTGLAVYYVLAPAEASTNLARFDGVRYGQRSKQATTLDQVYDYSKEEGYGREVKRRILLGTFVLASGYQDAYYKKAQKVRTLIIRRFQEAFLQCDLIAMPTSPTTAFKLGAIQDPLQMYLNDIYTLPANLAGLPAISVPCSLGSDGLPYGFQLMGPQRGDVLVCRAAEAMERVLDTLTPRFPA